MQRQPVHSPCSWCSRHRATDCTDFPGLAGFGCTLVVQGHRVFWEEEHEVRDIVKHIIKLKVACTLKSALHSCRLSTRCQSGSGSPQALTKKRKITSEMEVAPHYTLFTLFTLFTRFTLSILFKQLCQSGSCSPQLAQIKAKSLKISNK